MGKRKYPRSLAKFIRTEKAKIRRRIISQEAKKKLIKELIDKIQPLTKQS